MKDTDAKSIAERKRKMADRFLELKAELNQITKQDLLLMRTSEMEELGKLLLKCVELSRQLKKE